MLEIHLKIFFSQFLFFPWQIEVIDELYPEPYDKQTIFTLSNGYITFGLILERLAHFGGRILGLLVAKMGLVTLKVVIEKFFLVF